MRLFVVGITSTITSTFTLAVTREPSNILKVSALVLVSTAQPHGTPPKGRCGQNYTKVHSSKTSAVVKVDFIGWLHRFDEALSASFGELGWSNLQWLCVWRTSAESLTFSRCCTETCKSTMYPLSDTLHTYYPFRAVRFKLFREFPFGRFPLSE